ncbi:MAG: nucleotidyltransferase domain-containing protein [Candidatus Sumerlaeota bacterium]|nr:nucleotidyltransferase domain-containing protein [Candidatus Sumerlaeota bacterium]
MAEIPVQIIDTIKRFKERIRSELSVKKVILFGSYANGNFSHESDIDVCVIAGNVTNNYHAMLKIAPRAVEVDTRIEPVVFSNEEFEETQSFGLLRVIKSHGLEIK